MTLDELYDVSTGERTGTVPMDEMMTINQVAMSEHPFIWALDSYVFAGVDAHEVTKKYAQNQSVKGLRFDAYKIHATDADLNMTVVPVMVS